MARAEEITFFKREETNILSVFLNLDESTRGTFRKRRPYKRKDGTGTDDYAEISRWFNLSPKKSLVVDITVYDETIRLSSEDIYLLAEKLKELQELPEEAWSEEEHD